METRLIVLEKRIIELETSLNARLCSLEETTENRQAVTRQEIGGRVQSLDEKLELRLAGMEKLLQNIMTRLLAKSV
jgi:hypothetical protein